MDAPAKSNGKFSDLRLRIITGLIFAGLASLMLWQGGWFWYGFVALCAVQMLREWYHLTHMRSPGFRLLGIPYILLPCTILVWMYALSTDGRLVLTLVTIVAATDIGAYFAGRLIGGPKLVPRLSPNKTWAGLVGGMVAAALISIFWNFPALIAAFLAIVAQAGDVFESSLKRRAGVKDAGSILPGHGGLLDRLDGLLFSSTVLGMLIVSAVISV